MRNTKMKIKEEKSFLNYWDGIFMMYSQSRNILWFLSICCKIFPYWQFNLKDVLSREALEHSSSIYLWYYYIILNSISWKNFFLLLSYYHVVSLPSLEAMRLLCYFLIRWEQIKCKWEFIGFCLLFLKSMYLN